MDAHEIWHKLCQLMVFVCRSKFVGFGYPSLRRALHYNESSSTCNLASWSVWQSKSSWKKPWKEVGEEGGVIDRKGRKRMGGRREGMSERVGEVWEKCFHLISVLMYHVLDLPWQSPITNGMGHCYQLCRGEEGGRRGNGRKGMKKFRCSDVGAELSPVANRIFGSLDDFIDGDDCFNF